jgi:predicted amidohydrolase YtcJ
MKAYQELDEEGLLPIRVGLLPPIANPFEGDYLQELTALRIRTGFGSRKLRINGVKIALDGMLRSRTAALQESYLGKPENFGLVTVDIEKLREKVSKSHNEGLRACIHVEGDRGLDIALDAIARAQDGRPVPDSRHRIEHFGLCKPYQIERMKRLGVIPSVSINLVYEIGEGYKEALGEERCKYLYPLKALLDEGIKASCNSDWPVSNGNPLSGIYSAVNRETWKGTKLGPSQRISLMEAIKAYTINGAYASFEEDYKGSLEEGKLADLVVLSDDIFENPIKEILDVKIDITMVDGKIVYEKSKKLQI